MTNANQNEELNSLMVKGLFFSAIFIFSAGILFGQGGFTPSDAFLSPSEIQVESGETFSLDVNVQPSADGLSVIQVALSFDPTVVQIDAISLNPSSPLTTPLVAPVLDNENGFLFNAHLGFSAATQDFTYITLDFTALADGATTIDFVFEGSQETLFALGGQDVTGNTTPAFITVGDPLDCPELGANIGDPCDDGQANTENDVVTANCECLGNFVCANPFPAVDENSLGTAVGANKVFTTWNQIPNQIGCQIQVRFLGGPLLGAKTIGGANANSFNIPFSVLDPGTDYAWRVRCGCSASPIVAGPFTSWQPFSIPALIQLDSSPNPVVDQTTITFSSGSTGQANLEVYDITGKQVAEVYSGNAEAGSNYQIRFDASELPNGIYLSRLTVGNEVVTKKIVVSK